LLVPLELSTIPPSKMFSLEREEAQSPCVRLNQESHGAVSELFDV
jgi:hypothetical protein